MNLATYIDHTQLKAFATPDTIRQLCEEALKYHFHAVCVNGAHVCLAHSLLKDSAVKIAAVVGFPLGATTTAAKLFEAKDCIENGAEEIDMVLNIGALKAGNPEVVKREISALKNAIGTQILKVIVETCYLTKEEKIWACRIVSSSGADFIKTSTGFGTGGATLEDVRLIKKHIAPEVKIKAAGGIRDRATALAFIEAGANRIGTSSGIAIVEDK